MRARVLLWLTAVFLLLHGCQETVLAQSSGEGWTPPENIAAGVENDAAWDPRIAADVQGTIHVVWHGWTGEDYPGPESSNAVYYSRFDGEIWSNPVDIIAAPSKARIGNLVTTEDGSLIMTWTSGVAASEQVYVAYVAIDEAMDPRKWNSIELGYGNYPQIAVAGTSWYVSYASTLDKESVVVLAVSNDSGDTWLTPSIVWTSPKDLAVPKNEGGIAIASDGSIHLIWSEHTARSNWNGEAIWHARVLHSAEDVDIQVREVARTQQTTFDDPAVAASSDGKVFLLWNNGVGSTIGRQYQWSNDNGLNWSEVTAAFPGLSGQVQKPGIIFDSAGTLHLITSATGDGYESVLRYAFWREGLWSNYVTLWPTTYPGERVGLAITHGNGLHLVWLYPEYYYRETRWMKVGGGEIMYSSLALAAPYVNTRQFTQPPTEQQTENAIVTNTQGLSVTESMSTPSPLELNAISPLDSEVSSRSRNILMASFLPVLLLFLFFVLIRLNRSKARR